jgi:thioesterase domain-containing protein
MAHRSLAEMAACYVDQVRKLQPHGPYYLGGLCAGGVIAFEMARQLNQYRESVELVLLLDAVEPTTPRKRFFIARRRWQRFVSRWQRPANGPVSRVIAAGENAAGRINGGRERPAGARLWARAKESTLSASRMLQYEVVSRARGLSVALRFRLMCEVLTRGWAWPERIEPLKVREIYAQVRDSYVPQPAEIGRAVLVKATEGAAADEAVREQFDDPLLGWGRYVEGRLEAVDTPGGHSSMLQEPAVDTVAALITEILEASEAPRVTQTSELGHGPNAGNDVDVVVPVAAPRPERRFPPVAG